VLISGVGIADPTLAFWLRRGGFEPTLLECAPGFVVVVTGYDIVERIGLTRSSASAITHAKCVLSMKAR
jgi:hypothetical protein